jgi:hypothetical protein
MQEFRGGMVQFLEKIIQEALDKVHELHTGRMSWDSTESAVASVRDRVSRRETVSSITSVWRYAQHTSSYRLSICKTETVVTEVENTTHAHNGVEIEHHACLVLHPSVHGIAQETLTNTTEIVQCQLSGNHDDINSVELFCIDKYVLTHARRCIA